MVFLSRDVTRDSQQAREIESDELRKEGKLFHSALRRDGAAVNKMKCDVSLDVEFIGSFSKDGRSARALLVNNRVDNTSLSERVIPVYCRQFIERTEVGGDSDCCDSLKDKLR